MKLSPSSLASEVAINENVYISLAEAISNGNESTMKADSALGMKTAAAGETLLVTICVVCCFVICKSSYDIVRKWRGKLDVHIIGSGPVGLTAALIAAQSNVASKIVMYEERTRAQLMGRSHQIMLDGRSVSFMRKLGVDFDNLEGCWEKDRFYTRIGIFQDYLLSVLQQRSLPEMDIKLGTKFTEEIANKIHGSPKQLAVVVAADGLRGISSSILGLSDEFLVIPCKAYGAFSAFERSNQPQVPTPDTRVRKIKLDLSAFGSEYRVPDINRSSFHLKVFGTYRHRYMSLLCDKSESNIVRQLRITSDPVILRNIFQESFNNYRCKGESRMTDMEALSMRCSSRLTEIKLAYRKENVAYIEDDNLVILVEGDAARNLNQSLGFEVNLGLRGVESLSKLFQYLATTTTKSEIVKALTLKVKHATKLNEEIIRNKITQELKQTKIPSNNKKK
ncbi:hypothetical protein HOLleu_12439 [Holothuria leucospilota]|uniref:Uncharacterized protein n=1 Tax=Holothuria leucospilota TaxID=206669 RepID=A0A9Q1HD24_HOLLE|nr:hypothetical protein HOLleu_12439 [Holothuria leucospilota]